MYKPHQLCGLDVGNGTTTLVQMSGGNNPTPKVVTSFRSAVIKLPDHHAQQANYLDSTGCYLVGDAAVHRGGAERGSTDSSFYSSNRFRVLQNYALSQLPTKEDIYLVVGLPLECHKRLRKEHKDFVQKSANAVKTIPNVTGCEVIEQPRGSCFNPAVRNMKGELVQLWIGSTVIIDIGDGTLDLANFYDGNLMDDRMSGESHAISDIHKQILNALKTNPKHKLDPRTSIDHIDRAFVRDNGMFNVGGDKPVDLRKLKAFKDGCQQYLKHLDAAVEKTFSGVNLADHVGIAGGGVDFLGSKNIQEALKLPPEKLVVPPHPSHAIAIGYAFFAMHGALKKLKEKQKQKRATQNAQ